MRDCGPGIPADEVESVFDKFVQSSKTTTGAGGTGLGLAICRDIITAHGGHIWAECPAEGGALVAFTLPLDEPTTPSYPRLAASDVGAASTTEYELIR